MSQVVILDSSGDISAELIGAIPVDRVEVISDHEEVIDRVQNGQTGDLLVLHNAGQDFSGEILLAQLKKNKPDLRPIFIDRERSAGSEERVRRLGVLYYTEEPVHLDNFARVITRHLRGDQVPKDAAGA